MLHKIKTFFKLSYYLLNSKNCSSNVTFLSKEKTIDESVTKRKTIIRFGDGEFNFMNGKGVHYQQFDEELSNEINRIIYDYVNQPDCNYLLCMPSDFIKADRKSILKNNYFFSWPFSRYYFKRNLNIKGTIYGDSFIFAKNQSRNFKRIWINKNIEHIVFVNSNKENFSNLKKEENKVYDFVQIDSKNSYSSISSIMNDILSKNPCDKSVILVSAGPCAKAICYRLAKQGIYAVDTGHCWDSPLNEMKN